MTVITTHFPKKKAPCGRRAEGRQHIEGDDEGLSYEDFTFRCGCRKIRHIYHDGSVRIGTIRHDGKVLRDERSGDHEA